MEGILHIVACENSSESLNGVNNFLVPGTPEYNKVRYFGVHKGQGSPLWLHRLKKEKEKRENGQWVYERKGDVREHGPVTHPAHKLFKIELTECIARGLTYKTKTFEYNALTGNLFVMGKYIGHYDKMIGRLDRFTLKYIDTKLSRYRLRDFNINLVSIKGTTYWKMKSSKLFNSYLKIKYPNIQASFKELFYSIKFDDLEGITCGLRNNIYYDVQIAEISSLIVPFGFHTYDSTPKRTCVDETRALYLSPDATPGKYEIVLNTRQEVDNFLEEFEENDTELVNVRMGTGTSMIRFLPTIKFLGSLCSFGHSKYAGYGSICPSRQEKSLYRDDLIGVPFTIFVDEKKREEDNE